MHCLLDDIVEPKHFSKDALNQTGPENTSDKASEKSKSPKFVSPFKFQGTCSQIYTQIIVFFLLATCYITLIHLLRNLQMHRRATRNALQALIGYTLRKEPALTWMRHKISMVAKFNVKLS
jgi:hypothetical protein